MPTATNTIETRCRNPRCRRPITLDTGSEQIRAGSIAESMCKLVLCDECSEADDRIEREADSRDAAWRVEERRSQSGVPLALRELSWDWYEGKPELAEAAQACQRWAEDPKARGIYLWGPVGRGKTGLAATAAWHRMRDRPVRWVSLAQLMADLRRSWSDKQRAVALEAVAGAGAVVLDDLDKVKPSEWALEQLFAAIDVRVQARSPMLVTSNVPLSEIGHKYGAPIMSRLHGYCQTFEIGGPDRRLR